MHLKSLELVGFKSFAKKASLEFNSPITAIVGPNGSGKSNVAEAFRFVLGEQSIKSLRGKKGEDLIFNGSQKIPRMNRAGVKVIFDNRTRALSIDFDEVSLERIVNRDSTNEYLINGSSVRLKDIVELLAGAHIGSTGHHIISQGEADSILNASPKDRKAMIEDALGLKIYQYKRLESERKLEKTEENIKQVESLRREIAPHLRFLKKQVEKIEKTEEMRSELASLYNNYLKREDIYLKYHRERIRNERIAPETELGLLASELEKMRNVIEKSSTGDQKSRELVSLEEKLREVRIKKDEIMRAIGKTEGVLDYQKRQQLKLEKVDITGAIEAKQVEEFANHLNSLIGDASSSGDLGSLKDILNKAKEYIKGFIMRIRSHSSTRDKELIDNEVKKLESERHLLLDKSVKIDNELAMLLKAYENVKNIIEQEKDSERTAEKAIFVIMSKQNEVRQKLNDIENFDARLILDEESFKREIQEGIVLVGHRIKDYSNFTVVNVDGLPLSTDQIIAESRNVQDERRKVIERIKIRIEDSGVVGSDEVMKEYKDVEEREKFLEREIADLTQSTISLNTLIKELEQKLADEFRTGLDKINIEFNNFFALMFGGGKAAIHVTKEKKRLRSVMEDHGTIDVVDLEEPEFEEGIDIEVALPQKKNKGLLMLSGGERALTSIALLFAISQVNPPPFIILDETDAALDEANSRKYGDMIENLSKKSQLILITHNRETMSRAGMLYGVTVGSEGCSKLLSISFTDAVAVAK